MIDATSHAPIRYAFQNVQKSHKTMHDLLETLKNSVDFRTVRSLISVDDKTRTFLARDSEAV